MKDSIPSCETVSVIIPCYNGHDFLAETLDSALAQTHAPLEIIVIDDGSTDDSAEIAASYGSPVRVIQQSNQGESVARNRGIEEARGTWVAFLDADDLWRPDKLTAQLNAATSDTLAVHTNYSFFGDQEEEVDLAELPDSERYDLVRVCTLQNKHFNVSSLMVRSSYAGRFPTWTRYGEDMIYFAEMLLHQPGGVRLVQSDLVANRRHRNRQSANVTIQLYWHETVERWVNDKKEQMLPEVADEIQGRLVLRLVEETMYCYWRRDWINYWLFRNALEKYPSVPEVQTVLSQRVYPPWVYKCKDWFEKPREAVTHD